MSSGYGEQIQALLELENADPQPVPGSQLPGPGHPPMAGSSPGSPVLNRPNDMAGPALLVHPQQQQQQQMRVSPHVGPQPTMLSPDELAACGAGTSHPGAAHMGAGPPPGPSQYRPGSYNTWGPHGSTGAHQRVAMAHAMGAGPPPGPSQYRGVTRCGAGWEAGVLIDGRCAAALDDCCPGGQVALQRCSPLDRLRGCMFGWMRESKTSARGWLCAVSPVASLAAISGQIVGAGACAFQDGCCVQVGLPPPVRDRDRRCGGLRRGSTPRRAAPGRHLLQFSRWPQHGAAAQQIRRGSCPALRGRRGAALGRRAAGKPMGCGRCACARTSPRLVRQQCHRSIALAVLLPDR
jgi:hypothetical protein